MWQPSKVLSITKSEDGLTYSFTGLIKNGEEQLEISESRVSIPGSHIKIIQDKCNYLNKIIAQKEGISNLNTEAAVGDIPIQEEQPLSEPTEEQVAEKKFQEDLAKFHIKKSIDKINEDPDAVLLKESLSNYPQFQKFLARGI